MAPATLETNAVPLHSRPTGQVLHEDAVGLSIYSPSGHGAHCCKSCEKVPTEERVVEFIS
eukprot:747840-Rhodomonas_salina.1